MSVVGGNLKRIREERGYTRTKVGQAVFGHTTGSYIGQIEAGNKHPRDETIERLEDFLDVPRGTLKQRPARVQKKSGELPGT